MILAKKKINRIQSVRLLDFHICDEKPHADSEDSMSEDSSDTKTTQFTIQMFGINERGETFSIKINDFQPFFFVKVGDTWNESTVARFMHDLKLKVGNYYAKSIVDHQLVENHKLYGFSGGKKSKFIQLTFANQAAMNKTKNLWFTFDEDTKEKRMKTFVYPPQKGIPLELYESNIPPLLRYFHIHNISPSGWVYVPAPVDNGMAEKLTTCHHEIVCKCAQIKPIADKETRVPYKICSFDIEASSSHGDFPVPIKTYKRLATHLVDCFLRQEPDRESGKLLVKKVILTAFGMDRFENVDLVYPKEIPTKERVLSLIARLLQTSIDMIQHGASEKTKEILQIDSLFQQMRQTLEAEGAEGGEGGEEEDDEDSTPYKKIQTKKNEKKEKKKEKPLSWTSCFIPS